jgi:hypothetical protein
MWVQNYVLYWNSVQRYVSLIENVLSGAASGAQNLAEEVLQKYRSELEQAKKLLSEGSSLILNSANVSGSVNFSAIWKSEFDLESYSVGQIKQDLSQITNIVTLTESFFVSFFVNGGIDVILG